MHNTRVDIKKNQRIQKSCRRKLLNVILKSYTISTLFQSNVCTHFQQQMKYQINIQKKNVTWKRKTSTVAFAQPFQKPWEKKTNYRKPSKKKTFIRDKFHETELYTVQPTHYLKIPFICNMESTANFTKTLTWFR